MGRAGGSFAAALEAVGWTVVRTYGRHDELRAASTGVDLVLIATDDSSVAHVAGQIAEGSAVVAHVAGSMGLDALSGFRGATAAIHPLMSLPDPEIGAQRLLDSGWFATAGDPIVETVVADFGGRSVPVADEDRILYHATAAVAANHLTVVLAQVERLAGSIGLPVEPFLDLAQGSLESVRLRGGAAALTGPASRGDQITLDRHVAAMPAAERALYKSLMEAAVALAARSTDQRDKRE